MKNLTKTEKTILRYCVVESTPSGGKSISVLKNSLLPIHPEETEKAFLHLIEMGRIEKNNNSEDSYVLTADTLCFCTDHYKWLILWSRFKPTISRHLSKIILVIITAFVAYLFNHYGKKSSIQAGPPSSGQILSSSEQTRNNTTTSTPITITPKKIQNKRPIENTAKNSNAPGNI